MNRYRIIKRWCVIVSVSSEPEDSGAEVYTASDLFDPLAPRVYEITKEEPIAIYSVQVRGNLRWHTVKEFGRIRAAAEFLHELQEPRKYEVV